MRTDLLETVIPRKKLGIVVKALKAVFSDDSSVENIQLLTGGLSTALVYKITVNSKNYLLRIIMHVDALNDPPRQYACMHEASAAAIAPHAYYSSDEDALAITDFVEAVSIHEGFASNNDLLLELVKTIKAIHALPLFPKLIAFLDGVDIFIQQFKALRMFPDLVTEEYFEYYAEIQLVYPRYDNDVVSSHNDLNPNNILFDGKKIWIIDWETAFQNDRYADLAIISKSFVRDPREEELFLKAYFGKELDERKRARFFLMQQVCYMYYAMLMLKFAGTEKPANFVHNANMNTLSISGFDSMVKSKQVSLETYDGKLQYGKVLLNTMLTNMKSERFQQAIAIMQKTIKPIIS